MKRLAACIAAIALAESLNGARTSADAEKEALAEIVMIGEPGGAKCNSAGIIVGDDANNVYIVTTAHGLQPKQDVRVRFRALQARPLGKVLASPFEREGEGDLAVIEVKKNSDVARFLAGLKWDMLSSGSLPTEGSPVHSLGCSVGLAWNSGGNQEKFFQSSDDEVQFQSAADTGQSGGAVFNEAWELIAMVREVYDVRVGARRMDRIIDRIKTSTSVKLIARPEPDRVLGAYEVAEIRQRETLVRQLLVASATALQEKRLDAAQLLAAEAFDRDPKVARAGLYSAFTGALNLRRTLRGATGLSSAIFTPDGRRVLATGSDARLWDPGTGQLIATLPLIVTSHTELSPDGTRVVTTDGERARLWNVEDGTLVKALEGPQENAAFSPDGKLLITISGSSARFWEAATGAGAGVLPGPDPISQALFSPDGRHLLTLGFPNPRLWDLRTRTVVRDFSGSKGVWQASFNRDGTYLVLEGGDTTSKVTWLVNVNDGRQQELTVDGQSYSARFVPDGKHLLLYYFNVPNRYLDLTTGKLLPPFPGSGEEFTTVAFGPDGKLILSIDRRGSRTAQVWNIEEGKLKSTLLGDGEFDSAAFSPDSRQVVTTERGSNVAKLWNTESGTLVTTLAGHEHFIQSIAWDASGERILTSAYDDTVRIWTPFAHYAGSLPPSVRERMFSPDGAEFLTVSDAVRVWDTRSGRLLHEMKPAEGRSILTATTCPDGWNALISGADRDVVELWNVSRNSLSAQLKNPGAAFDVAWASIGKGCRYGLAQENGALWDLQQRRLIRSINGGWGTVFTPDGERILLNLFGPGRRPSLLTAADGKSVDQIPEGGENIHNISVSADGKIFLVLGDTTAWVWDSAGKRDLKTIGINTEGADRCEIGPSGKRGLVTNVISSWLKLLDLESGKIVATIDDNGGLITAVFSADDRWLVTRGTYRGTQLWDTVTGQPVREFRETPGVFPPDLSPDGRWVINSSGIWDTITGNLLARFSNLSFMGSSLFSAGSESLAFTGEGTGELWRTTPYPPERDIAAFLRERVARPLTPEERRAGGLPAAQ